jgi:cystathionine beta-lyase
MKKIKRYTQLHLATRCVHFETNEDSFGATTPPIYQTATFRQTKATKLDKYNYTRTANPTRTLLERQLAGLETGKYCSAFASGMAALSAVTRLVKIGEKIIAGNDLYGGTIRLLEKVIANSGITVDYVDTTDLAAIREALERPPRTRLIIVETPSNPLMQVSDVRALAKLMRKADAFLVVDNSMLSPLLQQPLSLGADIVFHSATKFLAGHSDVTAGAVITDKLTIYKKIAFHQNAEGTGLSPFESWLLLRGLKTLALRVKHQSASAQKIAEYLLRHRSVRQVYYPGLVDHPGHKLQRRQAISEGNGAVLSFTTGDAQLSERIVGATQLFDIAASFGSVNSSISIPRTVSHSSIPNTLIDRTPPADLIRISVGIEDINDLITDLNQAFKSAENSRKSCFRGDC